MNLEIKTTFSFKEPLPSHNPFADGRFVQLLEETQNLGNQTGWLPFHFKLDETHTAGFVKTHSYGEFIFDWAWADLYNRVGMNYYPKLIHMIPYTPVNSPTVIGKKKVEILNAVKDFYLSQTPLSSHHLLFNTEEENQILESLGYFSQETTQYHWINRWRDFDDFLSSLKSRKRKQFRKERKTVSEYPVSLRRVSFKDLTQEEENLLFELYLSTITKKHSHAYLNGAFFKGLSNKFANDGFVVFADYQQTTIAMSLFFYSKDALYGRYWGILPEFEEMFSNLHFELCFYQGMDFCFENCIPLFEAGAQGEQKLLRGFEPVKILSAHHIRHDQLGEIIKEHVKVQNTQMERQREALRKHLPYRD